MRFLVMVGVTCAIVYGILEFKKKIESHYARYLTDDKSLVRGASGGDSAVYEGASALLRAPRPELATEVQMSLALDQECKGFVSEIQKLDLIEMDRNHYAVSFQQIPEKPDTCRFNDPALSAQLQAVKTTCKPTLNRSESIQDPCAAALFMLRAAITRQMYAAKPLSSITDLRVLIDLMFAEFSVINNQTLPNLQRARAVADRMLDLKPEMYVAAKVIAFADVIDGLNTKARKPGMLAEEWTPAANAVARAKQINPNDESLEDAEMLIKTQGFEPKRALAYSDQRIQKNGADAKAWYLKAYAEWKLGTRPAALASLKRAVTLAPDNKEYATTYSEASRPDARADAFKGSVSFGVTSADFER